jgi:hypothetical protein
MLYREIIAVCSQIHTKHINTLCGQNVELLNVKPGGTYSDHCDSKRDKYTESVFVTSLQNVIIIQSAVCTVSSTLHRLQPETFVYAVLSRVLTAAGGRCL